MFKVTSPQSFGRCISTKLSLILPVSVTCHQMFMLCCCLECPWDLVKLYNRYWSNFLSFLYNAGREVHVDCSLLLYFLDAKKWVGGRKKSKSCSSHPHPPHLRLLFSRRENWEAVNNLGEKKWVKLAVWLQANWLKDLLNQRSLFLAWKFSTNFIVTVKLLPVVAC